MRIFTILVLITSIAFSQRSKNCAVLLKSEIISDDGSQIKLTWEKDEFAYEYTVFRKIRNATNFTQISDVLSENDTTFTDFGVQPGEIYEYQVRTKSENESEMRWRGFGYITTGIDYQLNNWKGKTLILVDSTIYDDLEDRIIRLEQDLAKEGWGVTKRIVSRAEEYSKEKVQATKQVILDAYNDDNNINSVILLGRIAVPYSGAFTGNTVPPDGHTEGAGNHTGAWPADCYYGDIDGNWLDQSVNITTSAREVNKNIPGDGKFDHIQLPSDIELAVGRIDFYDLPAFSEPEIDLYKRYLDKNHSYRTGEMQVERKALIDEDRFQFVNLGYREAFSSSGWRNFASLIGYENITSAEWSENVFINNYLWAYGTGAGGFTSAAGVVNTNQLSANKTNAVFTFLFGSYFGDYDARNNLMRASIASDGMSLTCGWAARPHWYMHNMSIGESIGSSLLISQNNQNTNNFNGQTYLLRNDQYYALAAIEANWLQSNGQKLIIEDGYAW